MEKLVAAGLRAMPWSTRLRFVSGFGLGFPGRYNTTLRETEENQIPRHGQRENEQKLHNRSQKTSQIPQEPCTACPRLLE